MKSICPRRRFSGAAICLCIALLAAFTAFAASCSKESDEPKETGSETDTIAAPDSSDSTAPSVTSPTETTALTLQTETGVPAPGPSDPSTETQTDPPAEELTVFDPVFSLPGGILSGSAQLSLTLPANAPAGAYIVYTTDGSEPTARGKIVKTEISLLAGADEAVTVIRAAVFGENGKQLGHSVTMSYLKAGKTGLRVVSLVTDPDHLYGTSGLFSNRDASGKAGEHPVSVEIYEPNGDVLVRQDAAIRLAGAGSRTFDPANLRIIARKPESFGADADKFDGRGKFHAQLFDGSDCTAYDAFLLRCGGNDSLHQANDTFLRMNMLRDAIANNVCADAEALLGGTVFAQRSEPAAVYINGSYYGMLNMKQDFDEDLVESLYGLPEEGIAMLKGKKNGKSMYYNVESGTEQDLSDWEALCAYCVEHALAADYAEAYRRVAEQLDVENFSRYYAVMLYLCNTDWPQNNTLIWRYTPTAGDGTDGKPYADGKWRAVIRDMDLCFALHDKASQTSSTTYSMADTDTFYRITVFYRNGGYHYDDSLGLYDDTMGFQGLFDFLIRSEEFRSMFRKHCQALASDAFAEMCRAEVNRYYTWAAPEIPAHIRLWQGKGEIHAQYTLQHFKNAKQDMLTFIKDRPAYFLRYMEAALAYYE